MLRQCHEQLKLLEIYTLWCRLAESRSRMCRREKITCSCQVLTRCRAQASFACLIAQRLMYQMCELPGLAKLKLEFCG